VTVSIEDAHGRVVPGADNEIRFSIEGEGRLIGVDNGDLFSHESYKGLSRRAFHGLCLAIVQSTAHPGQIQISASSQGLPPSIVVVRTGQAVSVPPSATRLFGRSQNLSGLNARG
jgi:beta-galactosidase